MGAVPPEFNTILEREKGLQRGLCTDQLSMIAIGGAIGTGLFLGSGFAIGFAGPSVLVSYLIGALITFLLMGCLAEMTVAHPTSGSFGAWAEFYIHPLAGFLVRYAYWAAIVLAVGTEVTAIALYMRYWYPGVSGWIWIASFSLALIAINARHVRLFGTIEFCLSALKIFAIVVFLLLGGWMIFSSSQNSSVGFANYVSHGGFFPKGVGGMWTAVIVALFSYFSVEMIAVAAGEARDPRQAITRAFRATFLRLVLFYLLTLTLILAIVPWDAPRAAQGPFVTVMQRMHIPAAAGIVNFVLLIAALSAMNSQLYITARMMFSLARAGDAPRRFGVLNAHGVPAAALAFSTLGIALAAILNTLYPDRAFVLMLSISIFGAMFTWLMIFVTHFYFRRRHNASTLAFRMRGFPYTTLTGALLMFATLITTLFIQGFQMTLLYGVPFIVILSIVFLLRVRRVPTQIPVEPEQLIHE
jgi:L-asparagine transporter-like permease